MKNRTLYIIRFIIPVILLVFLTGDSCKKVALFAGEGATILISSNKSFLKTGGDKAVISVIGFNQDGEMLRKRLIVS